MIRKFVRISLFFLLIAGFVPNSYSTTDSFKMKKKSQAHFRKNKEKKKSNSKFLIEQLSKLSGVSSITTTRSVYYSECSDFLEYNEDFEYNVLCQEILFSDLMKSFLKIGEDASFSWNKACKDYFQSDKSGFFSDENDLKNFFLSLNCLNQKDFLNAEIYAKQLYNTEFQESLIFLIAQSHFNKKNYSKSLNILDGYFCDDYEEFNEYELLKMKNHCYLKDFESAKEIALSFEDEYEREDALMELIKVLSGIDPNEALSLTNLFDSKYETDEAVLYVIDGLCKADLIDDAKKLKNSLSWSDEIEVADALISMYSDNFEKALEIRNTTWSWYKELVTDKMLTYWCDNLEFDVAEELVSQMQDDEAYLYLVYAYAKHNYFEDAKRIVQDKITDNVYKAFASILISELNKKVHYY